MIVSMSCCLACPKSASSADPILGAQSSVTSHDFLPCAFRFINDSWHNELTRPWDWVNMHVPACEPRALGVQPQLLM